MNAQSSENSSYSLELLETLEEGSNLEQLFDFKIKVDGQEFSLPTDFKSIEALGWRFDKNNNQSSSVKYDKGNVSIYAETYYDPDVPLKDLPVLSLLFSVEGSPDCEVALPGNIILGGSTTQETIAAYGFQSLHYQYADSRNQLDPFGIAYMENTDKYALERGA